MRVLLPIVLTALLLSGCEKQASTTPGEVKRYPLKGKVVSVDPANKKAVIDHEEIPDYMPAMEMPFTIKEDWVWSDLTPGAEVRAELVVDNTATPPYWLEKIGIIANAKPGQLPPPAADERFAQIGKDVPDFTLTNQDGKRISIKDFRGHPLAITFIYSECPLPDYCIKMSANFADTAKRVIEDPEAKQIYRLLSISFDPKRDTPAKLRSYGIGYFGKGIEPDFNVWQLAVGSDKEVRAIADFFGLRYEVDPNDKTQFNHSLRTAIISPEGKVAKILPGNEWTVNDLIREMKASVSVSGS